MGGPQPLVGVQHEPTITQSCGDLLGSDPMAWGQEGGSSRTLYGDRHSQTAAVATWHGGTTLPQLPTPGGQKTTPKRASPVTLMARGAAWGQPAPHARTKSAGGVHPVSLSAARTHVWVIWCRPHVIAHASSWHCPLLPLPTFRTWVPQTAASPWAQGVPCPTEPPECPAAGCLQSQLPPVPMKGDLFTW